ncbi:MAG: recombinase family protein [Planctomycetaceae bacterium]|nr:recombinase family protein [Planctomycetaceae bacterium]
MFSATVPLSPKDPAGPLKVLVIGRISTVHQHIENIDASYRYVETYLRQHYAGPLDLRHLGEQASGMLTDRATVREAEDLIATGLWDLVIAEDLSRIFRNPRHQFRFVQDAVDAETRVICIADNLDSADENWEIMMGAAALRHGTAIPDIRRRVRRTATHSFHGGGMVLKIRFGYRKLSIEEARSGLFGPTGLRIARRTECTPILRQMKDRVLAGQHYEAVADWLRQDGIEVPPYARMWTARLVKGLLADPILSGTRLFRRMLHRPLFRTGKHRRIPNPEPEKTQHPELAHFTPEEHTALRSVMDQRADETRRRTASSTVRQGRSRSRTRWPGQQVRCGACGGLMHSFGKHLQCARARDKGSGRCWNHVQVDIEEMRERLFGWLTTLAERHTELRTALMSVVAAETDRVHSEARRDALVREVQVLEGQANRLTEAVARGGDLTPLIARLTTVTGDLDKVRQQLQEMDAVRAPNLSGDESLAARLLEISRTSLEFADQMRQLMPDIRIQPVQALDTPLVRPRAVIGRLGFLEERSNSEDGEEPTRTVDLFSPPRHIALLESCIRWKQDHPRLNFQKIGERLGVSSMTVKRAFDYARRMNAAHLSDPYRVLMEKPPQASRWKRRRPPAPATIGKSVSLLDPPTSSAQPTSN